MTYKTVQKVCGPKPKYELTISKNAAGEWIAYVPELTYATYFEPHVWLRIFIDRGKQEVSIEASEKRYLESLAITAPRRAYQFRFSAAMRQLGIDPKDKIHIKRLSEKDGRIVFTIPKSAIKEA